MNKKDKEELKNINELIEQTENSIAYIKTQIRYYHRWYKVNQEGLRELRNKKQEIENKEV